MAHAVDWLYGTPPHAVVYFSCTPLRFATSPRGRGWTISASSPPRSITSRRKPPGARAREHLAERDRVGQCCRIEAQRASTVGRVAVRIRAPLGGTERRNRRARVG